MAALQRRFCLLLVINILCHGTQSLQDLSVVEKAVGQDVALACLGWTGDYIARGEHVLVQWLRQLPSGERQVLEELEVPTEPSVLSEKATDQDGIRMKTEDLSLLLEKVTLSSSGRYICHGSLIKRPTQNGVTTDEDDGSLGQTMFETEVKLQVHDLPDAPAGPPDVQVLSPRAIQVTWQALDDDITPVTGYLVIVSMKDADQQNMPLEKFVYGNINTTEVDNLWPYTVYIVRVRTVNGAGESQDSAPSIPVRTYEDAPEGKPKIVDFINGTTFIKVDFIPPLKQKQNGPLLGYEAMHKNTRDSTQAFVHNITSANATNYNFTGLEPFTPYLLSISAYNRAGMGPAVEVVIWTDEGLPGSPIIIHFQNRTHDMLDVVWERPKKPNGIIRGYHIYWNKKGSNVTRNATVLLPSKGSDAPWFMYRNYVIRNLEPTTIYIVRVSAFTHKGEGQKTPPQPVITDIAAPGAPKIVNLTANSSNTIMLFVLAPYRLHSQVHRYYVRYTLDGSHYTQVEFPTIGKEGEPYVELFLDKLLPGHTYQIQVAAATKSLFGPRFFLGDYSEPRVLALRGVPPTSQGVNIIQTKDTTSMATGIIAGVVCTAILLVVTTIVFIFIRRYLQRRYQFINDPDAAHLNTTLALPDAYVNPTEDRDVSSKRSMKNPDECTRESISVEDFPAHVMKLHADDDLGFSEEYEAINQSMCLEVTSNASHDPENRNKNRYINIVAYDHSRVKLRTIPGQPQSDYINANFIDGYDKPHAYIAAQGPLPSTFSDFWRMVWEQKSVVIVMITNLMERGRRKCDQYWPSEGEHQYDHMSVKLLNTYTMTHYTIRVFTLKHLKLRKKTINERIIVQYHYTDWPDHGVPDFTLPSLAFIRRSAAASPPCAGPPIIHCSAGVGRTGTYIVIDSMMKQIKDKNTLNVFGFLCHIRSQRNHLVQTEEQYIFIHDALLEHIQSGDTEVKASKMASYVERLLKQENEESLLEKQYKMVTSFRPKPYDVDSATLVINRTKNASDAFIPVERSRVCLPNKPGELGSDYINASYLHGYSKNHEFIVTQCPLVDTTTDFWRMVWDQNSDLLVLLSSSESDEDNAEFWPEKEHTMDCGVFKVTFTDESHDMGYVIREFILESKQDDYECTTKMISTTYWPEACSPLTTVFDLIQAVRNLNSQKEEEGPIIVIDRYGGCESATFCALYTLYDQLYHEGSVDVYMLAKLYHNKRPGVFPTLDSYHFLYKAILTLCSDGSIPTERDFGLSNGIAPHYATLTLPTEANGRASSKVISRNETTM